MEQALLRLEGIEKRFGDTEVLDGISLHVAPGEFITLLGPSGCGKTTTLRIIAGLEHPDAGHVYLNDVDVTELEPNKRDVNTVFQNYALFPHMNVETNIGYSLRLKRRTKSEIRTAVQQALDLVQLSGYEKRMPSELSGGQRQRVAIARAVVNQPKVLLLDEPLGALDLQLRRQMQLELKRLQKQLGITFIYITHDQEEALNMSDRIAVMRAGRFEQVGTAADIYDTPATSYVAQFVGNANILRGKVLSAQGGLLQVDCNGVALPVQQGRLSPAPGDAVTIALRSEYIDLIPVDGDAAAPEPGTQATGTRAQGIPATIADKSFAGGMLRITATLPDGTEVIASRHGIDSPLQTGCAVLVSWQPAHAIAVEDGGAP